jgi:hypothetical protein
MADLDVLAADLEASLRELSEAVPEQARPSRWRRADGRQAAKA